MKVPKGNGIVNVPMKTEADFIAATRTIESYERKTE